VIREDSAIANSVIIPRQRDVRRSEPEFVSGVGLASRIVRNPRRQSKQRIDRDRRGQWLLRVELVVPMCFVVLVKVEMGEGLLHLNKPRGSSRVNSDQRRRCIVVVDGKDTKIVKATEAKKAIDLVFWVCCVKVVEVASPLGKVAFAFSDFFAAFFPVGKDITERIPKSRRGYGDAILRRDFFPLTAMPAPSYVVEGGEGFDGESLVSASDSEILG
jgi:hypothetical protein